eukprot:11139193-Lingulodinium_polyedra.AAC.1
MAAWWLHYLLAKAQPPSRSRWCSPLCILAGWCLRPGRRIRASSAGTWPAAAWWLHDHQAKALPPAEAN